MSEQLIEMNKLLIMSNRISEIHVKNLKSYPYIFFDGVVKAEIGWNFDKTELAPGEEDPFPGGVVGYLLTLKKEPDNRDQRCKHLEQAVKNLFWKNTHVTIHIGWEGE